MSIILGGVSKDVSKKIVKELELENESEEDD